MKRLLPPSEALERYFALFSAAAPMVERVALDDADGRVLGAAAAADRDYPDARRSSMDGFAVCTASTPGTLRIAGEIRIGRAPERAIARDEAMRIPTGGIVPEGADAVVPIERVEISGESVRIRERVEAGEAVVARGADMRAGEQILSAGRRIGAAELALLATLGVVDVPVFRRPVVAVLSSGDELVAPAQQPNIGEVRDANRYAIASSLRALGAQPRHYPIVPDRDGALEEMLSEAIAHCDAAVVSGGSSVGEHDRTRQAIAALDAPGVVVHGLRVRPGRPTILGAAGSKPVIGLPGNPLSALVMLEAVAAPIFAAIAGAAPPYAETAAPLTEDVRVPDGWTWYLPVTLVDGRARPLPMRSFAASIAARASGYACLDDRRGEYRAGDAVRVRRFLSGGA